MIAPKARVNVHKAAEETPSAAASSETKRNTLKILKDLSSKMVATLNDERDDQIKNKSCKIENASAIVNGFLVTAIDTPVKPSIFKMESVSSETVQTEIRKRPLVRIYEPKPRLNKPKWNGAGEFVVTKIPKYDRLATYRPRTVVSGVTEFIVTSMDKKPKKQQKPKQISVESLKQSVYDFSE